MSGNEAIARGAYEAGVRFAAAYPGTPSTEILEEFSKYEGVYAEWSPNEKVAVEVAIGAALAGEKAMAVMKHVGVNVAADPIFTVSYTGITGHWLLSARMIHPCTVLKMNRIIAITPDLPKFPCWNRPMLRKPKNISNSLLKSARNSIRRFFCVQLPVFLIPNRL